MLKNTGMVILIALVAYLFAAGLRETTNLVVSVVHLYNHDFPFETREETRIRQLQRFWDAQIEHAYVEGAYSDRICQTAIMHQQGNNEFCTAHAAKIKPHN